MITEISDIRVWEDYYRNKQGVRERPKWGLKQGADMGAEARGHSTGMKDMNMQCDHNCR